MIDMRKFKKRSKHESISISSLAKDVAKGRLKDNHILQRMSGQWNSYERSEYISDILHEESFMEIAISEEINSVESWIIDGKQRCSNMISYLNNGFAISRDVKHPIVEYIKDKTDGDDADRYAEFDIRGKKFSQLPEELQDRFKDHQVAVLRTMNCTKKDIAYDIARFNRNRPMNKAQNGWTGIDIDMAEYANSILNMDFFKVDFEGSDYRDTATKNGNKRRMIVETITTINHLDKYTKEFEKLCKVVTENSCEAEFLDFYAMMERLQAVATKDVADMFNIKDSFIWFTLFDKFTRLDLDDSKFIEFMKAFKDGLGETVIDGEKFANKIGNRSTKDKVVVVGKLDYLEKLMKQYFMLEDKENIENININNKEVNDYIRQFNDITFVESMNMKSEDEKVKTAIQSMMIVDGKEDLSDLGIRKYLNCIDNAEESENKVSGTIEDTIQYLMALDDMTLYIDSSSKIFNRRFIPSLVKVMQFAYTSEYDESVVTGWLKSFTGMNVTQKLTGDYNNNAEYMIERLKEYVDYHERKSA